MTVTILNADAREALARFPDGHFHCCVTSPPFWGLRDYGLEPTVWGPDCEHEWGEEVSGRPFTGGDGSTSTLVGTVQAQRKGDDQRHDGGRSAFCRRCNAWRGTLGLEPTPELYVEHLVAVMREVRRVLRDDGTLWLNLGFQWDGRGNCIDTPHMVRDAMVADGWYFKAPVVWAKRNPMPESVTKRPTSAHEMVFLMAKHPATGYYYDQDAIREPVSPHSEFERGGEWREQQETATPYGQANRKAAGLGRGSRGDPAGRNRRSVWEIATQPYAKAHFATFPEKLVEPCILTTSEWGCCPECGAPWERVVEKGEPRQHPDVWSSASPHQFDAETNTYATSPTLKSVRDITTTGWRPTCTCCIICAELGLQPEVVHATQEQRGGTGMAAALVSEKVSNQSRLQGSIPEAKAEISEEVRPLRDAVSGTTSDKSLLQPNLLGQMDVGERDRESLQAGRQREISRNLQARPSDGKQGGIDSLPSLANERAFGAAPGKLGASPSSKRRQGRQSARESRRAKCEAAQADSHDTATHELAPFPPGPCRILDPFAGSGTVGLVAERLGRHSVLIDAKEEYCAMARHRTAQRGLMV